MKALQPEKSIKLGVVDHHTVYKLTASDCVIYYIYSDKPLAYIITEKSPDKNGYYPFRQAEKISDISGIATALMQFLKHHNIKLVIRSDEPMTSKGITWISKIIENPRGLHIHNGSNSKINLKQLWREWNQSLDDYQHNGNIAIYIESTNFNKKDYCFEDQTQNTGLFKNPLRYIGDKFLY